MHAVVEILSPFKMIILFQTMRPIQDVFMPKKYFFFGYIRIHFLVHTRLAFFWFFVHF